MKTKRPARPRLTRRLVEGIIASTSAHEAGGAEDMTGNDDAESQRLHAAVCDARVWAIRMLEWMDSKRRTDGHG